jgi:FAD/FMN-containing dehydrogenase
MTPTSVATIPREKSLSDLAASLRGALMAPGDAGFDEARRVFNGMIDRVPALIVRPAGTADVMRAVDFARTAGLPIAVRGGGHNVAGHGTCDGGLLIDFSAMRSVRVDRAARTARAEPGCSWTDFDVETTTHGLATTGGTVGSTGIAGLTLGGGLGFLMGSYGLSCDNVLSVDIVTADGSLLTASEQENPDLYWAIRGGGGNFGAVTSFEYRLHPVATMVAGLALYPIEHAAAALKLFRDVTAAGPDELSCAYVLITLPDGAPVAGIAACYNGPLEAGEAEVQPFRKLGPPLDDGIRPMNYLDVQRIFAEIPFGLQNYWKGHFVSDLPDSAVDAIVECFHRVTSTHSAVLIEAPHGAASRVGPDETAYSQREARFNVSALSIWEDPREVDPHVRWARDFADSVKPFSKGGVYVNYLGDDAGRADVVAAYGPEKYRRLAALKRRYDPDNLFRFNQNIPPGA